MNEVCPDCPDETHYYCKQVVIGMLLEALDSSEPQKEELRCGRTVEIRLSEKHE